MAKSVVKFDWFSILLYLLLVGIGWVNIYSATLEDTSLGQYFDLSQAYGRQLLWIGLSVFLIVVVLSIEAKFYERFSSLIYLFALLSLAGLFVFGKTIAGQTAWYSFGSFSIQPAEFVKIATALALAKYISSVDISLQNFSHQLRCFLIIGLPIALVLMQPDPGSAMVYFAFIFPLFREGLPGIYLWLGFATVILFVATLAYGTVLVSIAVAILAILMFFFNRKRRPRIIKYLLVIIACIAFSFSVDYVFDNVFKQHHRDRFNIVLGLETDLKGAGYNTRQSEIAVGSGNWFGKGWTEGTQTKGNFVPEQHTDYIFSTVGEEWGFVGSITVVALFVTLLLRFLFMAERQKSQFSRMYGYSVIGILLMHFGVNIGMVIGILPTVGIPLPFFSYGGSGLWAFTILVFIFIKLDSERMSYW